MKNDSVYHIPVLLQESVQGLITEKNGIYVDVTFGGGGHSREVLSNLGKDGRLIGFDQDEDAMANVPNDERFQFVQSNFRFLKNRLRFGDITQVDGVLADLGVSSHQFDIPERGFSIRADAKLDMRMGRGQSLTAARVVNTYAEEDLIQIFRNYGELREAHRIASRICGHREINKIQTTGELIEIIETLTPRNKRNKFLAKVFQALRIEVNAEMKVLEDLLVQCAEIIRPGGRLVIISYHSLEDRMVKFFLRSGNVEGKMEKDFYGNLLRPFTPMKGMPVVPKEEEIEKNPRARSAKLRIGIKNE